MMSSRHYDVICTSLLLQLTAFCAPVVSIHIAVNSSYAKLKSTVLAIRLIAKTIVAAILSLLN